MKHFFHHFLALTIILFTSCQAHTVTCINPKERGSLSNHFLQLLANITGSSHFIETGTLTGTTTIRAASFFKRVYTIEFSSYFFNNNKKTFQAYPTITALLGDSGVVLSKIVPTLNSDNAIFFLDAHYSGGNTAQGDSNTPLLKEIATIGKHIPSALVIIDDLRLCQNQSLVKKELERNPSDTTISGYPTINELENLFKSINPDYEFIIWGDVGIAFPMNKYLLEFSPALKAMTASRFFDESVQKSALDTRSVIEAELALTHVGFEEKAAIASLIEPQGGLFKPELLTTHYRLWNGLVFLGEKKYSQAIDQFRKCKHLGFNHWRLPLYLSYALKLAHQNQEADKTLHGISAEVENILEIGIESAWNWLEEKTQL